MLIGNSTALRRIKKLITQVAPYNVPVLISGETGTGKELVAQLIHDSSYCADGPFVSLHTGAIQQELLMSELFGHEKGAFTGAESTRKGKLELANGGTLFLDEIGTMEIRTQIALLKVLETKSFFRVGGSEEIFVDLRILAATNINLKKAVKRRLFRKDLLYRLSGFEIKIPPLRRRKKDIAALVDMLITEYNREFDKDIKGATRDAIRKILNYPWPGNVRELQNALLRAVITTDTDMIDVDTLPDKIRTYKKKFRPVISSQPRKRLEDLERQLIRETLKETGGNRENAAQSLGISRKGLYNKMKKHGLLE